MRLPCGEVSQAQTKFQYLQKVLVGDQVAIVGLFLNDYGESANLPITRFGHVSRMPSMVNTPRWKDDDFKSPAYLLECLSWAGLSGSPVMAVAEIVVNHAVDDDTTKRETHYFPALLGVVNGHLERRRETESKEDFYDLNTGIAIATPAIAVTQLLNHPEFIEQRTALAKLESDRGNRVVPDCIELRPLGPGSTLVIDPKTTWKLNPSANRSPS